jgi:hypothetical protein
MGLAQVLLPPPLFAVYRTMKWMFTEPEPLLDGEFALIDEGPDDIWPPEEYRQELASPATPELNPELIVTQQWGLRCPGGEVHWNLWQGIGFEHPLGRLKMVATLQQTALDMGFAEDQVGSFLDYYGWVTRNQIATVVYEDTGAYPLTDSAVSAVGTPENGELPHDDSSQPTESRDDFATPAPDPLGDLRSRSVGGDER